MGNKASRSNHSTELTMNQMDYLLDNTHFSRKEIKEWHKNFIKECPQGTVSKEKFKEIYRNSYQNCDNDLFFEYLFKSFDLDDSNEIDFVEFLIPISITSRGDEKEKLQMAFRLFDIDKNKYIDKNELETIIRIIYDLSGETHRDVPDKAKAKARIIMNKFDTNNDGVISEEEFINGCMNDDELKDLLAPCAK